MPGESTTPDLVDLVRGLFDAGNRRDADAILRFYAPDAVYDLSSVGLGRYEGHEALRGFWEDWWSTYEEYHFDPKRVSALGHGVIFAAVHEDGRLVGSDARLSQHGGYVFRWVDGIVESVAAYSDIDEARAAAERLAEERG